MTGYNLKVTSNTSGKSTYSRRFYLHRWFINLSTDQQIGYVGIYVKHGDGKPFLFGQKHTFIINLSYLMYVIIIYLQLFLFAINF